GGVKFDHSIHAKSNNGIYALMDLKDNNQKRFTDLRGIVSEGRHRVNSIEEKVKGLFLIVTNPEDEDGIVDKAMDDRKKVTKMNYVLVPKTQNKIFHKVFGDGIDNRFHPNIIDSFSRILISTRMITKKDKNILLTWIDDADEYSFIIDDDLLILRMQIYDGDIPEWLSDIDVQNFVYDVRKSVIDMALEDGEKGVSDRKAIEIFGDLINYYSNDEYIGIKKMKNYCERVNIDLLEKIPQGFVDAVERYYIYIVSQEIKECMFVRNEEKIKRDLKNYLYSLNYNIGDTLTNPCTSDTFVLTKDWLKKIEMSMFGAYNDTLRRNVFKRYISETICYEDIEQSEQFKKLYADYTYGLKSNILKEFQESKSFVQSINDYGTEYFNSYDNKIRKNVDNLITNMVDKYNYTTKSAKEVCRYIFR
ncbi:hypothetical protein AKJ59_00145, partial [candidate division MSBL1 archaeon SCGC-AAA385M02]